MPPRSKVRGARRSAALVVLALCALAVTFVAGSAPAGAQTAPTEEEAAQAAPSYPESGDVTVAVGDTLYGIARRTLGNGARYTEIFERNRGVPQQVGGTLTDPGILRVGWVLSLPPLDPAQGGGGGTTPPDDGEDADDSPGSGVGYTVVRNDTLYGIAQRELGDGSRYDEIFQINRGRPQTVGGTLTNPSVLRVGWVLELPAETPPAPPAGETRSYTVQRGDSLSRIAQQQLGDASRYTEIFELNEGVAQANGGALTNPSQLRVGWVLQLPAS
jgi:nucleoid-associated protein YgaU